ncbi:hypothetical protein EV363DRAFT_3947 [Boletus edulis]|nr:hypothetical protein EV363DRAFT_3947 [Boletus edulis]
MRGSTTMRTFQTGGPAMPMTQRTRSTWTTTSMPNGSGKACGSESSHTHARDRRQLITLRKKHAREYEEQAKRDAQRAAQKAREKEIKAETSRIERLAREQEGSKARERQRQGEEDHRQRYEQRWKALLDPRTPDLGPLMLADIPWPLFSTMRRPLRMEDIIPEAITTFLLPDIDGVATSTKNDHYSRRNRDKLKETLLRFHPDKFEGRFMHRVPASDTEVVKEAVGQVARVLNVLMSGHS